MVLDINRRRILEDPSLVSIEAACHKYAYELAVLGEIAMARQLMALFYLAPPTTDDGVAGRSLDLVWHATGKWPEGCPEQYQDPSFLGNLQSRATTDWPPSIKPEDRTYDAYGLDALLELIERYHEKPLYGIHRREECHALAKALDISAKLAGEGTQRDSLEWMKVKLEVNEQAGGAADSISDSSLFDMVKDSADFPKTVRDQMTYDILRLVADRFSHLQDGQEYADLKIFIEHLVGAAYALPLFADGGLRFVLDLDKDTVHTKARFVLYALRERMQHGRPSPNAYAATPMRYLLNVCNDNSMSSGCDQYWGDDIELTGRIPTLFKEPADKATLSALEKRLGTALPTDFKQFLQVSNGFGLNATDDKCEFGIYNGAFPTEALYAAEDIKWVDTASTFPLDMLEIPRDLLDSVMPMMNGKKPTMNGRPLSEPREVLPLLHRVLEIGKADCDSLWLVPPKVVNKAKDVYFEIMEYANKTGRKSMQRAMEAFAGSKEDFGEMEWVLVRCLGSADCKTFAYSSLRTYLERLAVESGRNLC
ncbi:MAG: hypothetical protein Q9162_004686 [Coniocarpon cinnabarinum]